MKPKPQKPVAQIVIKDPIYYYYLPFYSAEEEKNEKLKELSIISEKYYNRKVDALFKEISPTEGQISQGTHVIIYPNERYDIKHKKSGALVLKVKEIYVDLYPQERSIVRIFIHPISFLFDMSSQSRDVLFDNLIKLLHDTGWKDKID